MNKIENEVGDGTDLANTPRSTLSQSALHGVLWLVLQSLGGRAIGILSQLALAWILDPESFGIIGIVYAFTSISGALVNFGIDDVLLQREGKIRFWIAPALWTSLGLSLLGFGATIALAFAGRAFYDASGIIGLAICAGLVLPLGALQTVPTVILKSKMDFRTISAFNISEMAFVQIGVVALALGGAGVYSFVVPGPIVAVVKIILLWKYVPIPALKRCRPKQLAYMINSGTTVFQTRLINASISQGDYLVLGLVASRIEVGIYYFGFKLAAQPLWVLAANFTGVLFPVLIKLKQDQSRQVFAAISTARLLSYAVMPLCCLQAALAGPALHLLFGSKWLGATPVIQFLSLGLAFDAVTWVTGTLLSANREYRRVLAYTASFAPMFFVLVLLGAWARGATGAAGGVALFYCVMGPSMCWLVFRHYGCKIEIVANIFIMPTVLAIASVGPLAWMVSGETDIIRIVVLTTASPIIYLTAMALFVPLTLHSLLQRILPHRFHRSVSAYLDLRSNALKLFGPRASRNNKP